MASGFSIIAVAIGLIFTYMTLSLLVSSISTLISQIANTRARNLKNDLKELVGDDDFAKRFFTHPLINLSLIPYKLPFTPPPPAPTSSSTPAPASASTPLPAPAKQVSFREFKRNKAIWVFIFAAIGVPLALISGGSRTADSVVTVAQWVTGTTDVANLRAAMDVFIVGKVTGILIDGVTLVLIGAVIGRLIASAFSHRINDDINDLFFTSRVDHITPEIFASVIERLTETRPTSDPPETALKDLYVGLPLAAQGGTSPEKRERLIEWFKQWDRNSTAQFRRRQSVFAFVVALILAITVNADTLQIASALYGDSALRDQLNAVIGSEASPANGAAGESAQIEGSADAITELLSAVDTLLSAGLPIGWELTPVTVVGEANGCFSEVGRILPECDNTRNLWLFWGGNTPNYAGLIFRKVVGILLTAVAVAQGAPFWFDLLNRLLGRSSSNAGSSTNTP